MKKLRKRREKHTSFQIIATVDYTLRLMVGSFQMAECEFCCQTVDILFGADYWTLSVSLVL